MRLTVEQRLAVALRVGTTDWSVKRYLRGANNQNARLRARIARAIAGMRLGGEARGKTEPAGGKLTVVP